MTDFDPIEVNIIYYFRDYGLYPGIIISSRRLRNYVLMIRSVLCLIRVPEPLMFLLLMGLF